MIKDKFREILPGKRIIKTVLSVLICLTVAHILGFESPYFACIACIVVMKKTAQMSLQFGVNRVIGTLFGAVFAALFVLVSKLLGISEDSIWYSILVALVLLLDMWIVKIIGFQETAISLSAILVLSVLLSHNQDMLEMMQYIGYRTVQTIFGVVVALLVNRFIWEKES